MNFRRLTPGWRSWMFGVEWHGSPKAFKVTIRFGPIGLGIVKNPTGCGCHASGSATIMCDTHWAALNRDLDGPMRPNEKLAAMVRNSRFPR